MTLNYHQHIAAGSGTLLSLLNGGQMLQSLIVGIGIYIFTSLIKWGWSKLVK